jgi:hypothetical protein
LESGFCPVVLEDPGAGEGVSERGLCPVVLEEPGAASVGNNSGGLMVGVITGIYEFSFLIRGVNSPKKNTHSCFILIIVICDPSVVPGFGSHFSYQSPALRNPGIITIRCLGWDAECLYSNICRSGGFINKIMKI